MDDEPGYATDPFYVERNRLIAALARAQMAKGFRAGIAGPEAHDPPWRRLCYIETDAGQLSWHFPASHLPLFHGLPPYDGAWDGHSKAEKYARLDRLG